MTYIPKNKIQAGLYTKGGEYSLVSNRQPYSGYYYKLATGKAFSGKNINDPNSKELIPTPFIDGGGSNLVNPPIPYSPLLPTEQDYKNGSFNRYFSLRLNQPLFVEISKATVNLFSKKDSSVPWKTNKTFSLTWQLTGDINQVAQTNKNITELTEQRSEAYGLSVYLKEDWTQYYKEKP
jgi:hypothetical protein